MKQDTVQYTRMQVGLHWLIAVLIAGQFLLHDGIKDAWDARLDGTIPNEPFPNLHAIAGIVILLLMAGRIVLRLRHGAPKPPAEEPRAFAMIAQATHLAFYGLLIALPVSGAAAWVLGLEPPADLHEVMAKLLLALIVLHIVGAVAQKVWFKTEVMARMSPKLIFGGATDKGDVR